MSYQRILLILWSGAIVAWIALRSSVFFTWPAVRETTQQKIGSSFAWGFAAAVAVGSLLQVVLVRRSASAVRSICGPSDLGLHSSATQERAWFALVSVTAGSVKRFYMADFLSDMFPTGLARRPLDRADYCQRLIRAGPRIPGIIRDHRHSLLGAVMAVIFFATGSLWLPMALHAMIDLRLLLLLGPGDLAS